ncbi:hypothetical protein AAG906_028187 [Vitis piasezkii]
MAMVTLTSGCNNFSHSDNHLRDVSFSSYVNGTDEPFVLKLAESNGSLSTITTSPQERLYLGRKKAEDGEIGPSLANKIRGMNETPRLANKNGGTNEEKSLTASKSARRCQHQNEEGVGFEAIKPKIQPGTPSMISESSFMRSESSWDSQSALLTSVLRNPPRNKTKMTPGKSLLASLCCKCSCSDKNSVETDEYVGENRSNKGASCGGVDGEAITKEPIKTGRELIDLVQINKQRSESWGKEAMHHKKFNELGIGLHRKLFYAPIKLQLGEGEGRKPRKSLEIFGSPILQKGHKSLSLERRLTMLSWEATPRVEEPGINNDTESDASSDLFEIESLSSRVAPFLARQESDGMSGCITPTTCYAPSEASIEWSVVTASVADYSVMSDSDEQRPPITPTKTASKEVKRRPPSILSGCKNDKAVRVAGDAYMTNDKAISDPRGRHRSSAFVPMPTTRFEAETTLTGFGSGSSFSRSHSQHASHLLYI